jgi:hypothetical protein
MREAQLADALSHVTHAAAAAATAASTAASACALPAYDHARTFALLQQLSPPLGPQGGRGDGYGSRGGRGRRRRGSGRDGGEELWAPRGALAAWDGGNSGESPPRGGDGSSGGSSSGWSDEPRGTATTQDGDDGAARRRELRRRRGERGAAGARRRERRGEGEAGDGPLGRAAAAVRQAPQALLQAPGWLMLQAGRARRTLERGLLASRGGSDSE